MRVMESGKVKGDFKSRVDVREGDAIDPTARWRNYNHEDTNYDGGLGRRVPHQNEPPSFQQYMDSQYRDYSNFLSNRFGWGEPNRTRAPNVNVRANQGRN